jgi:chromosome segregation ATPase
MASLEPEKPFDDSDRYLDPVYECLKLRAEAAEEAVKGTKHHANCMALRSREAAMELKKAKLEEEKARYTQRSDFYAAQAERRKRELGNSDVIAEHVSGEMNRQRDKASQLKGKCANLDAKIEKLNEKIQLCREEAETEERLKTEAMQKSKQLEIQAMKYEKS